MKSKSRYLPACLPCEAAPRKINTKHAMLCHAARNASWPWMYYSPINVNPAKQPRPALPCLALPPPDDPTPPETHHHTIQRAALPLGGKKTGKIKRKSKKNLRTAPKHTCHPSVEEKQAATHPLTCRIHHPPPPTTDASTPRLGNLALFHFSSFPSLIPDAVGNGRKETKDGRKEGSLYNTCGHARHSHTHTHAHMTNPRSPPCH